LRWARITGLVLALAVLLAAAAALWSLDTRFGRLSRDREVETARFVEKVRACRRANSPTPSWQACEEHVRAAKAATGHPKSGPSP